MRRLIWGFVGRTYHIDGNLMLLLNSFNIDNEPLTVLHHSSKGEKIKWSAKGRGSIYLSYCSISPHKVFQHGLILFDLILYVPSTIFQLNRDGSSWVEPVLSWDKCVLLKDHNAVTPVILEPAAPQSWVKQSTTEPLHSQQHGLKHTIKELY